MTTFRIVLAASLSLFVHVTWVEVCWSQMIVAHRGASEDAPENTLAAFQLAWQQNADAIEGDFHLTADQQIVCIHDFDTERTGGRKLIVKESTLAELRQLEYGSWKDPKWKGEIIPTFEQVLATVPDGKMFVIELKSKGKIATVLAQELKRLQPKHIHLRVITFDEPTALEFKRLMPGVKLHWLTKFEEKRTDFPYGPTADEIAAAVRRIGAEGVGMKAFRNIIDADFIARLAAGGCHEFHVFTVDSVSDARYFQQLGVVGITTNRPGRLRRELSGSSTP